MSTFIVWLIIAPATLAFLLGLIARLSQEISEKGLPTPPVQ